MRIVPKLTVALVACTCIVLAVNGYFRVRRETRSLEAERTRRHLLIGRAVGAAVRASWRIGGEQSALATLGTAVARYEPLTAEWVPIGAPAPARLGEARGTFSEPRTVVDRAASPAMWITYVPIVLYGERLGDIELTEAATADADNARDILVETAKMAAGLVVLSAVLAFVLGHLLVGRPIRALTTKARRIGLGDFAGPLVVASSDELAELGREMNAMSEKLGGTLAQLRHADRLATVGKLASGLAHELGTPLNVVSARAEMIATGDTCLEESRDYAKAILKAATRMQGIIGQLLQFARRGGIQRAMSEPAALAREAIELLRPLAKKRQVRIELECAPCEAIAVDGAQVQQVLTNLLMNAIQASSERGRIRVAIDERSCSPPIDVGGGAKRCTCMFVTDEGVGIESAVLPRIFEPFFTTKEVGEGTGLGLAVSYGIVREHGGWMTVESPPGAGATFGVYLPHPEQS